MIVSDLPTTSYVFFVQAVVAGCYGKKQYDSCSMHSSCVVLSPVIQCQYQLDFPSIMC